MCDFLFYQYVTIFALTTHERLLTNQIIHFDYLEQFDVTHHHYGPLHRDLNLLEIAKFIQIINYDYVRQFTHLNYQL